MTKKWKMIIWAPGQGGHLSQTDWTLETVQRVLASCRTLYSGWQIDVETPSLIVLSYLRNPGNLNIVIPDE